MNCLIITIILGLIVFLLEFWTEKKNRKFLPAIKKAMISCEKSGQNVETISPKRT